MAPGVYLHATHLHWCLGLVAYMQFVLKAEASRPKIGEPVLTRFVGLWKTLPGPCHFLQDRASAPEHPVKLNSLMIPFIIGELSHLLSSTH
jgi:hypothetical protein